LRFGLVKEVGKPLLSHAARSAANPMTTRHLFRRAGIAAAFALALAALAGGADPPTPGGKPKPDKAAKHWAFQPARPVAPPPVKNAAWVRNPIDAFIAAQHEARGLTPAAEADRRTLLRRVTLDLTGLPPTPAEIDAFLQDTSADAYEKVVDRLLASPAYGERWGRHWLDVARWAESEGYESNHLRPHAWRYRDWVVRSVNQDLPFADFVRAQLAGDEIEPYSDDNLIATGFLAAARLSSNEEDKARQRNDMLVDIANATGNAFLGLTFNCAQCHAHKFDPISARDYYRFQGFFLQGHLGNLALRDADPPATRRAAEYDRIVDLREAILEKARLLYMEGVRSKLSPKEQAALAVPPGKRTPAQEKLVRDSMFNHLPGRAPLEKAIPAADRKLYDELKARIALWEKTTPERPQTAGFFSPVTSPHRIEVLPMKGFYPPPLEPEELAHARPRLLFSGDVHTPRDLLDVGWPAVFGPTPAAVADKPRLALAAWLTDPANPLTARVYVNRLWQGHFGRGIVATPGDFGTRGAKPSHPELLDWLAGEFLRQGGSSRKLHRLIVTSATYRQSARASSAENAKIDPNNVSWWRWQPRRLEAEAIRDSLLAVSGELDRRVGGPGTTDEKSMRRSIYLFQKRHQPPAVQALFDGPNGVVESCPQRHVSTAPLQALYLLNNDFSVQRARALARRLVTLVGDDRGRQVEAAFVLAFGRPPDASDRAAAERFFKNFPSGNPPQGEPAPSLVHFCQALLNANEFVYLD
jgi:hypothetical protein